MSEITRNDLLEMSEKLRVYDVEQSGWEHESQGLGRNARLSLFRLAEDLAYKDHGDREVLEQEVIPDALQYGLRLVRWTRYDMDADREEWVRSIHRDVYLHNHKSYSAKDSYKRGVDILAGSFLSADDESVNHESPREARRAGQFLVVAAGVYANEHDVDVMQAFDNRLANLRERFGIPAPIAE